MARLDGGHEPASSLSGLDRVERLHQLIYRLIGKKRKRNEEIMSDPKNTAVVGPDGIRNPHAQRAYNEVLTNERQAGQWLKFLTALSKAEEENIKNMNRQ